MDVETMTAKVEKGAHWLAEQDHDPPGRFYLWWKSGLMPGQKMPAQPQEVQDRYSEWHRAFSLWLRLYRSLEAAAPEQAEAALAQGLMP